MPTDRTRRQSPPWRPGLLFLIAAVASGCSREYDVTPSADSARAALAKALDAWRAGDRPGEVEGSDPPVQVVDSTWQAGQALSSYEILREEPGGAEKRFVVRLDLKKPPGANEARYVVIGKGPIWIYREEDYQRSMNMDNNPITPRKGSR